MKSTSKSKMTKALLGGALLLLLVFTTIDKASAVTLIVDFDALDASAGSSVTGATLDAYLAGFGITISNVTPSGFPEVHDATGPLPGFPDNFLTASSPPNFMSHGDGIAGGGANAPTNNPISYTLNFSTPLDSVSFTRIQINASTSASGSIVAAWSARALDSLGNTIGTVGEPQIGSFGTISAATFTLPGPDIAALVVERTSFNFSAGINTVFIDDLVLTFRPTLKIEKLLDGPEQIGIYLPDPTQYVFEIVYTGPAAVIEDAIPAEFEAIAGGLISTAGNAISFRKGNSSKSATHIKWVVPAGSNTLTVAIQTVVSPGKRNNKKEEPPVFKPTSCGPLPINDGATAFEEDPDNPGEKLLVEGPLDPETGLPTLVPVVIVGPSNSLVVEAVAGAKPCEEGG